MRTKLELKRPDVALTLLLDALGQELIDASDEEIMEAAKGLGMNPMMRGSAAFSGLKFPAKLQLSDFFEFEAGKNPQVAAEPIVRAAQRKPRRKTLKSGRFGFSTEGKIPRDK